MSRKVTFWQILLLTAALLLALLPAEGRDRDDACAKRIQKAEQQLHQAERKHGLNSKQAQNKRHHLDQVRDQCRGRDHDRDRDRDHDRH